MGLSVIVSIFFIVGIVFSGKYPILGAIVWFLIMSLGVAGGTGIFALIFVDSQPQIANMICIGGFIVWLILTVGIIRAYLALRKPQNVNIGTNASSQSNTTQGTSLPQSPKISDTPKDLIQQKKLSLREKIDALDIGTKDTVIFFYKDGSGMRLQLKNLAKIVQEIINEFHRSEFAPGELENHFHYIKENYATSLNSSDYSIVLKVVERFVKEGGRLDVTTS
ncbi:MAG: hypothetical protein HHAS10_08370 [Candidatus Altimarinota bacterium]